MKIAIASDHAGIELKKHIVEYVNTLGYKIEDFGPFSTDSVNYPTYGKLVAQKVANNEFERGILICGSGAGISMSANKVRGIRCVLCSEPYTAAMSREHNDSNVLAMGARVISFGLAEMITKTWLEATFEGGRHAQRLQLLHDIENE